MKPINLKRDLLAGSLFFGVTNDNQIRQLNKQKSIDKAVAIDKVELVLRIHLFFFFFDRSD